MKRALTVLALAASTLVAATSNAAPVYYRAVASGPAEDIPNGSPGSSVAAFEIDDMILRADIPFRDLSSPTISAHIHCCTVDAFRGVSAVAIPFLEFPLQVTAGVYSAVFDLAMRRSTTRPSWQPTAAHRNWPAAR